MNSAAKDAADRQCIDVEAGSYWRDETRLDGTISASGATLTTTFDVLASGQVREVGEDLAGEEVVAIMSGEFDVDAAGEQYRLGQGEAILIPPGAARRFTCLSARGVLYRAGTALAAASTASRSA